MAKQTFTTGQVLTAAQMTSLQQTAMGGGSTTAKTASYTLVAADAGTVVQMNSSSATTITVNQSLFAQGDTVEIQNVGSGVCTVTAGSATVNTSATLALKQYDAGSLYFNTTSAAFFFAVDAADSPLTTKGDLFTFSTAAARLPVGSDAQTLVADSTASTGLKWATPASSSGLTLISTTTIGSGVSSTSLAASTFTSTYTNYRFLFTSVTSCSANITVGLRLRSGSTDESGAAYSSNGYKSQSTLQYVGTVNTTSQEIGFIRTGFAERAFIVGELYRPQEAIATMITYNYAIDNAGNFTNQQAGCLLNTSTSYDSMSFIYAGGNVTGGKISVYGYNI